MPDNNTLLMAENIGPLNGSRTFNKFVGTNDRNDYYSNSFNQPRDFSLLLTGLEENADVALLTDLNNNTEVTDNEVLRSSTDSGSSHDRCRRSNMICYQATILNSYHRTRTEQSSVDHQTNWEIKLMPNNNTPDTAENIGPLNGSRTFNNFVGTDDRNDYYRFSPNQPRDFSLLLTGLEEDADVALLTDLNNDTEVTDNEVLRSSTDSGSSHD